MKLEVRRDRTHLIGAIAQAGIPVFAQFGLTPQTSALLGGWDAGGQIPTEERVDTARSLEVAGASLLDLTRGGPATSAVTQAVRIPVLGGVGTEASCDGHIRTLLRMAGQGADTLDLEIQQPYGQAARVFFDALTAYANDIRGGAVPRAPH